MAAVLAAMPCAIGVSAEDAQTETTEHAQQESQGEYIDTFWNSDSIIGDWRGIWINQGSFSSELRLLTDKEGSVDGVELEYEFADNKFTFPFTFDENGATMSGELVPLEEADIAKYGLDEQSKDQLCAIPGQDYKIILDITRLDDSDPLNAKEDSRQLVYLKEAHQNSFFEDILYDHVWDVKGKTLEISEDGALNLNDGEATGYINAADDYEGYHMGFEFFWEEPTLNPIDSFITDMSPESVTFARMDAPEEATTFTLKQ